MLGKGKQVLREYHQAHFPLPILEEQLLRHRHTVVGTGGSSLAQWFVAGDGFAPGEHLAMPGDIFGVISGREVVTAI